MTEPEKAPLVYVLMTTNQLLDLMLDSPEQRAAARRELERRAALGDLGCLRPEAGPSVSAPLDL